MLLAAVALTASGCSGAARVGPGDAAPSVSTSTGGTGPVAVERVSLESVCYGACAYVTPSGLPDVSLDAVTGTVMSMRVDARGSTVFPITLLRGAATPQQVDDVLALVERAGLPADTSYPRMRDGVGAADGGGSILRVTSTDGTSGSVEAPHLYSSGDDLYANQGRRLQLRSLRDALAALAGIGEPYQPLAHAVVAESLGPANGPSQVAWTGPDLAQLPEVVGGVGCAVLSDQELAAVDPTLRAADQPLVVTDGGRSWTVQLRPLLPHERTCADLHVHHSEY